MALGVTAETTMSAPTTEPLELMREAWAYWRTARDCGDILEADKWLSAIDHLLDRPDFPRAAA